ncbi:MAG TPA: DNA methyltransferase [Verrucomicrobiae bacterium]|nr:DNA methyltransferase [Verrucomicrobiae bacterium]
MQPLASPSVETQGILNLSPADHQPGPRARADGLLEEILRFRQFGQDTRRVTTTFTGLNGEPGQVPALVNEFWTARQRQASSLHEVSYRACFKPQLPRFFIERLTVPGEVVYDPFMGRGTTVIEAGLLDRVPFGNDINPLSLIMTGPRLSPPALTEVEARLKTISLEDPDEMPEDLLAFYHPTTLRGIASLKKYLLRRQNRGESDAVDKWIALVALNRLTGHSNGFFSVYTLPPNQAVSPQSQQKINAKRNQVPPPRDVLRIILKKTRQLLRDVDPQTRARLQHRAQQARLLTRPADHTPEIPSGSVALVVTSPPFLNVVQYATDNWLRCWFLGIDAKSVKLTVPSKLVDWRAAMTKVFQELHRVLKPGGHVAFEVGEVHNGKTKLEEAVLPSGWEAGLNPLFVLINDQEFTKTANCWGVDNMNKGTNTNRIVLFRKQESSADG